MSKTPATKITITRAEGPSALCGETHTFEGEDCWDQARSHLFRQSSTFPREGGYDKHDFEAHFEDDDSWKGRLDCKHHTCSDPDLDVAKHILDFATFHMGERCPARMTQERYNQYIGQHADFAKQMREFLATYEIPGNDTHARAVTQA